MKNDMQILEAKLRKKITKFDDKLDIEKNKIELAIQIANEREKLGLTQKQLAERIKTTQSVISRIESGRQNMTIDYLFLISQALGHKKISISFQ